MSDRMKNVVRVVTLVGVLFLCVKELGLMRKAKVMWGGDRPHAERLKKGHERGVDGLRRALREKVGKERKVEENSGE